LRHTFWLVWLVFWHTQIGDLVGKKGLAAVALHNLRANLGVIDLSKGYGTANTALVYHNRELLALHEADMPYVLRVLEDGDIETASRLDYDKKLNHAFTAHPKIDPKTGEMFTFGYHQTQACVTYRVISKDGVMGHPVSITLPRSIMMHDFAITKNYAIFLDCPLYFNPKVLV
jgi:carotenoid cleavage dioxygenase-like enzyme